jgi:uncharacterized protein YndB with AHSA1/START domain
MPEPRRESRTDSASREVAAPPDRVYAAFADPAALIKWLPPAGMNGRVLEYDFREGGRFRIELTYGDDTPGTGGKTTGRSDISSGRFLALDAGRRVVQSVEFESADPSLAGAMTMTWTFERVPGGTRVTITADDVPSAISKADHDAGLRSSLDNLAQHLR